MARQTSACFSISLPPIGRSITRRGARFKWGDFRWPRGWPSRHATALILLATPVLADVAGVASVIDGDTIEVHGQRISLHGIDAPESRQLCRLDGEPWQCGKDATNALVDKITRRPVYPVKAYPLAVDFERVAAFLRYSVVRILPLDGLA